MPDEASQVTKPGWPDVLAPFTDLMHSLCGPAFTEYGLAWGDSARAFRLRRLKRLLEKTQERLNESGSQPEAVKFSLLNDIMNHGSAEDDDDLQDRWANLLSNAADPRYESVVQPSFPNILSQLSKEEALFLDELYELTTSPNHFLTPPAVLSPVHYENLRRLGLIVREHERGLQTSAMLDARAMTISMGMVPNEQCFLSEFGTAFIAACRAPKKRDGIR
jgi:hypothetical protein